MNQQKMTATFTIVSTASSVCSSRSASPVSPCYSRSLPVFNGASLLNYNCQLSHQSEQSQNQIQTNSDNIQDTIMTSSATGLPYESSEQAASQKELNATHHRQLDCDIPFILIDDYQHDNDIFKISRNSHPFKRYYPSNEWPIRTLEQKINSLSFDCAARGTDESNDDDDDDDNIITKLVESSSTSNNLTIPMPCKANQQVSNYALCDYASHADYDHNDYYNYRGEDEKEDEESEGEDYSDDEVFTLSGHSINTIDLHSNRDDQNNSIIVNSRFNSRSHENLTSESHDNDGDYNLNYNCNYNWLRDNNATCANDNTINNYVDSDSDITSNYIKKKVSNRLHRKLPLLIANSPIHSTLHSNRGIKGIDGSTSFKSKKLSPSPQQQSRCKENLVASLAWPHLQSHLVTGSCKTGQALTLEDLKIMRDSCSLCGCNWQTDHLSFDCRECGGYTMKRPCPICKGKCPSTWTRNVQASHDQREASWTGVCQLNC